MCQAEMPAWAMLTFGVLAVALGFEMGRCYCWIHQMWENRRNK